MLGGNQIIFGLLVVVIVACPFTSKASGQELVGDSFDNQDKIQFGTYTDAILREDVLNHIKTDLATKECDQFVNLQTIIYTDPSGEPKKRYWRELWVIEGCDQAYYYLLSFLGDGQGGTYFTIRGITMPS